MPTELPTPRPKPINPGTQKEPETPTDVAIDKLIDCKPEPDSVDPMPEETVTLPVR